MRFSNRSKVRVDEENPYWMSFSDIMASLLVIFILASAALVLQLTEQKEELSRDMQELKKAEEVRRDILREIKEELRQKNIIVETADNDTVLRVPEQALSFVSGRYDIPQGYIKNVQEIGDVLYQTLQVHEGNIPRWNYLDTVFIEGHTDDAPYRNEAIKGNWGLSTFRAISVWEQWVNAVSPSQHLATMKNHLGDNLFSVSGYADSRPAYCNNAICDKTNQKKWFNPADRDKNRRIDIRITVKNPSIEDFQKIIKEH